MKRSTGSGSMPGGVAPSHAAPSLRCCGAAVRAGTRRAPRADDEIVLGIDLELREIGDRILARNFAQQRRGAADALEADVRDLLRVARVGDEKGECCTECRRTELLAARCHRRSPQVRSRSRAGIYHRTAALAPGHTGYERRRHPDRRRLRSMRAQSSVTVLSVVVVVLALVSGCSPDEPDVVAVVPEPPAPAPEFEPGAPVDQLNPVREGPAGPAFGPGAQVVVNGIRARSATSSSASRFPRSCRRPRSGSSSNAPTASRSPCACFATGSCCTRRGTRRTDPSLSLRCRAPPGVHYRAGDIDFRSKDDLATLEMGRERYVDCVANPAAAVWQETLPRITTPR